MQEIAEQVNKNDKFKELNWQNCLGRFKDLPLLDPYRSDGSVALDYIDFCSVYSSLLQADRGSFYDWSLPEYSIKLNTDVLIRPGPLSDLRRVFQEKVLSDNDFVQPLMVLEAPTGIGKTKIFLDIIEADWKGILPIPHFHLSSSSGALAHCHGPAG